MALYELYKKIKEIRSNREIKFPQNLIPLRYFKENCFLSPQVDVLGKDAVFVFQGSTELLRQ